VSGGKTTVYNPMGFPPKVTGKALSPRLQEGLDGKTIFLVDCRFDDAALLLEQMQRWFAEHLPAATTRLVRLSNMYARDDPELWGRIKSEGDGAIIGVGH
jgi:hypothetical protein